MFSLIKRLFGKTDPDALRPRYQDPPTMSGTQPAVRSPTAPVLDHIPIPFASGFVPVMSLDSEMEEEGPFVKQAPLTEGHKGSSLNNTLIPDSTDNNDLSPNETETPPTQNPMIEEPAFDRVRGSSTKHRVKRGRRKKRGW